MSDDRRARTRTLIQLGGLVENSGVLDVLGITMGQDLQKDPTLFNKVAILSAALKENTKVISQLSETDLVKWIASGRNILKGEYGNF